MKQTTQKIIEEIYKKLGPDTLEKSEWQKIFSGNNKRYKYVFGHLIEEDDNDEKDLVIESKYF